MREEQQCLIVAVGQLGCVCFSLKLLCFKLHYDYVNVSNNDVQYNSVSVKTQILIMC